MNKLYTIILLLGVLMMNLNLINADTVIEDLEEEGTNAGTTDTD